MKFAKFVLLLSILVGVSSCNNGDENDPVDAVKYFIKVENNSNKDVYVYQKTDLENSGFKFVKEVKKGETKKLSDNYVIGATFTFGFAETKDVSKIESTISVKNDDAEHLDYIIKVMDGTPINK